MRPEEGTRAITAYVGPSCAAMCAATSFRQVYQKPLPQPTPLVQTWATRSRFLPSIYQFLSGRYLARVCCRSRWRQSERSQPISNRDRSERTMVMISAVSSESLWKRIKARCVWIDECFVWQGAPSRSGYGQIKVGGGSRKAVYVHRIAYEHVNGPVPDGFELDHVRDRGCRFRACCNVAHLEPVTHRVNTLRSDNYFARNARKTVCPQGHPLSGDNLLSSPLRKGRRKCRACKNESMRRSRLARRHADQ